MASAEILRPELDAPRIIEKGTIYSTIFQKLKHVIPLGRQRTIAFDLHTIDIILQRLQPLHTKRIAGKVTTRNGSTQTHTQVPVTTAITIRTIHGANRHTMTIVFALQSALGGVYASNRTRQPIHKTITSP